ncbi:MAG: trigger factor [Deltaproteobacteria bacterium RIFCSPLOWO2_02_FULL_53_8]|nr:MAG: trigger factor [Deltaproteobacteria bacterium RIFCSPLOWO2_02_FULL_53_8]
MQNANINVVVEDLGQVKKKLNITIPTDMVNKEIKTAYASLKSDAHIPGFRKGAVPMSLLKKRFGTQVDQDVKMRLIENSYTQAINEKLLVPVVQPQIEEISTGLSEGNPFSYAVTVEINPDIDVDGYRGMSLRRESAEVTDKDFEEAITKLRESRAEYEDTGASAKDGDAIVVDFEGFLNGEPVKNGKAKDYSIIIGQKTVLPGFDEALIGANKGEVKEFTLTIPANYSEREVAGKDILFKVTINEVKRSVLPALDDEFAKDLECENMAKLNEKVMDELKKIKENIEKERLKNLVLDALIEKFKFEVPDALVRKYAALNLNRVMEDMKRGRLASADRNLSPDELSAKYTKVAMRQLKEDLILDAIAVKEDIKISKAQVDGALEHLAAMRNLSVDELASRLEREGTLPVIVDGLKHEKVFDIVFETAKYE